MYAQTVIRVFVTVAVFAVVGLLTGGVLGFFTGMLAPQYYISVFDLPRNTHPDTAAQTGAALGMTQGVIVGALVGLVAFVIGQYCEMRARGK